MLIHCCTLWCHIFTAALLSKENHKHGLQVRLNLLWRVFFTLGCWCYCFLVHWVDLVENKSEKIFHCKTKKTSFSTVKPTEEFFLCWFISCDEARWGMSQECFSHKIFASTSICLKICSEKSFWFLSCWEIRSLNYHDTHLTWDFYIYAIMIVSQQSFSTIF